MQTSHFLSFCPAILLLCNFRPYFLWSKPVKPGHNRALWAHILRVFLTKYGDTAQEWNSNTVTVY